VLGNDEGVYVGGWLDKHGEFHYLRHNGPEHVLCYAPTRSGKGVGLVVPTFRAPVPLVQPKQWVLRMNSF